MLPVLFDLSFIKIYTFGVFLVLAFFWSTFLLWKNVRLTPYKEEVVFDTTIVSLLGGLFFGRLWYVVLHFDKFGFNLLKFFLINGYPGVSVYGCLLGFLLVFFLYANWKKVPFKKIVDYLVAPILVALAIGKIGAFFAGVEVGTKTKFFLALKYTNFDGFRHLTALYEGILFFIGAFICYKLLFQIRREKYNEGVLLYFLGWYFSLIYVIFDPLKDHRDYIAGVSVNWAVSLVFLLTFSLYFLYHLRSFFFSRVKKISNSHNDHDNKTISPVHSRAKEEVRGGSAENSSADSKAEK